MARTLDEILKDRNIFSEEQEKTIRDNVAKEIRTYKKVESTDKEKCN